MQQQRVRSDEDDDVDKAIEDHTKNHNGYNEKPNLRCRVDTHFSSRICWSNLQLESIMEPPQREETKPDGDNEKRFERKLAEKDAFIGTLKKDLHGKAKSLVETEKLVEHLKVEVQRRKDSEKRLYDLLKTQTTQLEQAMIFIDKWKHKMAQVKESKGITGYEENYWLRLQVDRLENELRSQSKGPNPWEEVLRLRRELELAIEAEVKSKRAMDDLASVIKEVASEANEAKEKFTSAEKQRQLMEEAIENLKSMMNIEEKAHQLALTDAKNTEEKNLLALAQIKKESESLKSTINRLKIEVKESLPYLNGKESVEYVDSIKKAEDEKVNLTEEKEKLVESLNEAKEESRKLREILKQAKVEIFQLKDSLTEKDLALTQETEKFKEMKKQKKKNKDSKGSGKLLVDLKGGGKSTGDLKSCGKSGSFCSLPLPVPGMSSKHKEEQDPDDDLTDSIFDIGQPPSARAKHHHTRSASAIIFTDDLSSVNSDDFDGSDRSQMDDMEIEKGSQPKKRVLLRKFSELWRRKSHSHSNSQSQSHNHKELANA